MAAEARGISLAEGEAGGHEDAGRRGRRVGESLAAVAPGWPLLIASLTMHLAGKWGAAEQRSQNRVRVPRKW